jgi:Spy/CpxP family protein refolding chaperone
MITLLALGGLLAFSPTLPAQETNAPATPPTATTPAPRPRGFENIAKQLDLTPDQQPKVKAAFETLSQKMRDLRGLAPEDRRAKAKAIREEANETLKTILTPEQYAKWLKLGPGAQRAHPAAAPATPPPAAAPGTPQ